MITNTQVVPFSEFSVSKSSHNFVSWYQNWHIFAGEKFNSKGLGKKPFLVKEMYFTGKN